MSGLCQPDRRPPARWLENAGLLAALLLLLAVPSFALDPKKAPSRFGLDVWENATGLPQNSVYALQQGRDGYVWLGTQEGLVRFDGVRFAVFSKDNTQAMANHHITALHEGLDGRLWIGTPRGLLSYRGGLVTGHSTTSGPESITALQEDETGVLWVGTSGRGLHRLGGGRFTRLLDPLVGEQIRAIHLRPGGGMWIASEKGLASYQGGRFHPFPLPPSLPPSAIATILPDGPGRLWAGTDAGLILWEAGAPARVYTEREGLAGNMVRSLYKDSEGSLWVGTRGGLDRLRGGRLEPGPRDVNVVSLLEDREGSLWFGTAGSGLRRLRESKIEALGPAQGLPRRPFSVTGDASGRLWVGTTRGDVAPFVGERFTSLPRFGSPNVVRALYVDRKGGLWVGLTGAVHREENGRRVSFSWKDGLPSAAVNAFAEDSDGRLFVATEAGLYRFDGGRFVGVEMDAATVTALARTRDGTLWFGGDRRLGHLREGRLVTVYRPADGLADSVVKSLYEDARGVLWIGTRSAGLQRLEQGRFTSFTTKQGLLSDTIFALLDDGLGRFWMSSNRGLFRVNQKDLEEVAAGRRASVAVVVYDETDGMPSRECNSGDPAAWKTPDGRLWFPTLNGMARVEPAERTRNDVPPPVLVEEVSVDGQPAAVSGGLPRGWRYEFRYTALSFLAPHRIRFKHKLEGFDKDWVQADTRRVAYYTHLPPGHYRFRVIACNNDGVWNEQGAQLEFRLPPRFYETTAFYLMLLVAAGFLVLGVHRLRVRQLKTRAHELTLVVEERTRTQSALQESHRHLEDALEQLHRTQDQVVRQERLRALGQMASGIAHDFNNALAPLVGFSELLLLHPEKLQDQRRAQDYLRHMNTAAKDASQIVSRLREFYRDREDESFHVVDLRGTVRQAVALSQPKWKDQAQAAGVTIRIETLLQPVPLVAANESELREALINLILNAVDAMPEGGTLTLATRTEGEHAVVEVRDAGIGMSEDVRKRCLEPFFTTKGERGSGLGLAMVYGILKRHDGAIDIDSVPGRGTTFVLRLPSARTTAQEGTPQGPPPAEPLRVLAVDDEPLALRVLVEYLREDAHQVESASSGQEGLAKLKDQEFDLVIVDRAMPGMSGDQFAATAKQIRPETPILLLTGFGDVMNAAGEQPEGVDLVLSKPATIRALREALHRIRLARGERPGGRGGEGPAIRARPTAPPEA